MYDYWQDQPDNSPTQVSAAATTTALTGVRTLSARDRRTTETSSGRKPLRSLPPVTKSELANRVKAENLPVPTFSSLATSESTECLLLLSATSSVSSNEPTEVERFRRSRRDHLPARSECRSSRCHTLRYFPTQQEPQANAFVRRAVQFSFPCRQQRLPRCTLRPESCQTQPFSRSSLAWQDICTDLAFVGAATAERTPSDLDLSLSTLCRLRVTPRIEIGIHYHR